MKTIIVILFLSISLMSLQTDAKTINRHCLGTYYVSPGNFEFDGGRKMVSIGQEQRHTEMFFVEEFLGQGSCRGINPNKCRRDARKAIQNCANSEWRMRDSEQRPIQCRPDGIKEYDVTNIVEMATKTLCDADVDLSDTTQASLFVSSSGQQGCGGGSAFSFNAAAFVFPIPHMKPASDSDSSIDKIGAFALSCPQGESSKPTSSENEEVPAPYARMASIMQSRGGDRDASQTVNIPKLSPALVAQLAGNNSPITYQAFQNAGNTCKQAIQGEIAWNYQGNAAWNEENISNLCGEAKTSIQPATCFQRVMHGGLNWGAGIEWNWQETTRLCSGTKDANARIDCFEDEVDNGVSKTAAITKCAKAK